MNIITTADAKKPRRSKKQFAVIFLLIAFFLAVATIAYVMLWQTGPRYSEDELTKFRGEFSAFMYPSQLIQDEDASKFEGGVQTALFENKEEKLENGVELGYVAYDLAEYHNLPDLLEVNYDSDEAANARDTLVEGVDQLYRGIVNAEFLERCEQDPVFNETSERFENNGLQAAIVTANCTQIIDEKEVPASIELFIGVANTGQVHWLALLATDEVLELNRSVFDTVLRSVEP